MALWKNMYLYCWATPSTQRWRLLSSPPKIPTIIKINIDKKFLTQMTDHTLTKTYVHHHTCAFSLGTSQKSAFVHSSRALQTDDKWQGRLAHLWKHHHCIAIINLIEVFLTFTSLQKENLGQGCWSEETWILYLQYYIAPLCCWQGTGVWSVIIFLTHLKLKHQCSPRRSSTNKLKLGTSPSRCFIDKESLPIWQVLSNSGILSSNSPNLLGWSV